MTAIAFFTSMKPLEEPKKRCLRALIENCRILSDSSSCERSSSGSEGPGDGVASLGEGYLITEVVDGVDVASGCTWASIQYRNRLFATRTVTVRNLASKADSCCFSSSTCLKCNIDDIGQQYVAQNTLIFGAAFAGRFGMRAGSSEGLAVGALTVWHTGAIA